MTCSSVSLIPTIPTPSLDPCDSLSLRAGVSGDGRSAASFDLYTKILTDESYFSLANRFTDSVILRILAPRGENSCYQG